ncbi:MAG TPA: TOBE domain-containing protein, partial [Pseudolabrys sp.]|nr:TOBE domain-containing protein [Pseudolabrys sp.]
AVMNRGRLAQVGEPAAVYEWPASRWVADFIGEVTIIPGRLGPDRATIKSPVGALRISSVPTLVPGEEIALALRPEKLVLAAERTAQSGGNALAGVIGEVGYRGDVSLYQVQLADGSLIKVARANTHARGAARFAVGDRVWVSWPADAGVVLKE